MTPELTALTYAALLQCLQLMLAAVPANIQLGMGKTLSPRDKSRLGGTLEEQVDEKTARLFRAYNNHIENLLLFAVAVTVISLADKNTGFSAICAWIYLSARILYITAYYFGLSPWRTLIWATGWLATILMLLSVFI